MSGRSLWRNLGTNAALVDLALLGEHADLAIAPVRVDANVFLG